jgi:hypothetical protein
VLGYGPAVSNLLRRCSAKVKVLESHVVLSVGGTMNNSIDFYNVGRMWLHHSSAKGSGFGW